MIIPILYMLFILAYAVVPFLYKSKCPAMLQFYLRMVWSRSFRRCYTLAMLASLMVFHFYHLNVFGNVYELACSSLVCVALYSHKNTERAFDFLQRKRCFFWVAMFFLGGNDGDDTDFRSAYATPRYYGGHSRIRCSVLSSADCTDGSIR